MRKILGLILLVLSQSVSAEDGVTADSVTIGMSNALSGPSAALGTGMKQGVDAYFSKINKAGGVHGRKLVLKSLDDQYEPAKAVENTEKLIGEKSFVLLGYVGTPTSQAVMPLVGKNNIPYIAPFTGAEAIRNPVNKNVFNVRASYFDETEALVERFTTDLGIKKIGIFIQDDGYGAAGEAGVLRALKKRDMSLTGKGIYKRNTVEIDAGFEELKKAAPEAIIMVGTYKACAAFVKKAKASGLKAQFANVSFVGTAAYIQEGGADVEGTIISQVFPSPSSGSEQLVKDYQADMKAAGFSSFEYTSIEGYAGAKVFVEALKSAGKELTRDSLRASLEKMNSDIGGFKVAFSPSNHSGSTAVYMTIVKGGKAVQVTSLK